MSWPGLPLLLKVAGRPVILLGEGEAADAKRRILDRAGAIVVGEATDAMIAIVAIDDHSAALAAIARLKARGVLVNAVDRPEHCDFTLPAIVDRSPVLVAVASGGVSAGLAAALRQRIEALLPPTVGALAERLHALRPAIRLTWPDPASRRRALGTALAEGGALDPLTTTAEAVGAWLTAPTAQANRLVTIRLRSGDADDLTLGEARALALADRIYAPAGTPLIERARADAVRVEADAPPATVEPGLSIWMELIEMDPE